MADDDDRCGRPTDRVPWSTADRRRLARRITTEHERANARAVQLTRAFAAITEAAALAPPDDEHDPDGATVGFERAQVAALLERAHRTLAALERATERLGAGTYGLCVVCGCEIGLDRLDARPTAERCIACASSDGQR